MTKLAMTTSCLLFAIPALFAQVTEISHIPAAIHFEQKLQDWDGFGFNYVESAQTRDYVSSPQDYGGFSLLGESKKQEILQLIFGENGLNPSIVKMFLDPWHQKEAGGAFDHETSTRNLLYFVENGLNLTHSRGEELEIITTLYGPPAWATVQKQLGGRDLDTSQSENLARYMVDWIRYLQHKQIPVKYISIHNEGEDFYRWTNDLGSQKLPQFDYNMYWPPEQVNDFIKVLHRHLQINDLNHIGVTNGEPSNWTRFYYWGYARSLYEDDEALEKLGLLTTHGFFGGNPAKLSFGLPNSLTSDLLRSKKPGLHAWVTSFSWGKMDTKFIQEVHENIYTAKVNALIPWAGIQDPTAWLKGDPNPGTAIIIHKDGTYELTNGYYFYKQLTTAGKKGMAVAPCYLANPLSNIIAFSQNDSKHPDAFVVSSYIHIWGLPFKINIHGSRYTKFKAFRTKEDGTELYKEIGVFELSKGAIIYDPPYGSTTTFIGID